MQINKTISLQLEGLDGNAFMLIGAFRKQAKREDWSAEEIDVVTKECESGDYDHLVQTLIKYTN